MEGRLLLAILVDTLADEVNANGVTSLREAIVQAASSPGDDVITFAPDLSGAIDLALGQLTLDDHSGGVTIEATPTVNTIDAGGNSGVFYVANSTTAVLNGLTITGGRTSYSGGGIVNLGTLTLTGSTVSGNSADRFGGGVYSRRGTLTVTDSTVSGNSAGSGGGGVYNFLGALTLTGSTISGNKAAGSGGGVDNFYGTLTLTNSTISGNTAAYGGGVWSSGSATITHATITDNMAAYGGGLWFSGPTALFNTIVSGNRRDDGAATPDDLSAFFSGTIRGAGNLIGTGGEALDPDSNLVGVLDPRLGPLADNGGSTWTHLPLADSPAIDGGLFLPTNVAVDQRGEPRPRGLRPDVGAVEVDTGPPSGVPEAGGTVVTTLRDIYDPYDGLTSIREALAFAASHPGGDVITFDPSLSGVVELKNFGELALDDATGTVTIEASAGVSTMDAAGLDRVLRVASGTTAVLDGWTLQGGAVAGDGGGVWNSGTLTLAGSTVSGNSAGYSGGGIDNWGTLTLAGSTVSGNTANVGGGVYNRGTLTVTDSTISGNSAGRNTYGGGGIFNSGTATLTGSTVSGNSAGYSGGGIDNWGTLTLTGSTVSGNSAGIYGGGILNNFYGTLTLTDSTLSGNRSEGVIRYGFYGPYAFGGDGGGLFNSGSAALTNSTIAGNTAARYGGGVDNSGTLTLVDSTISDNSAAHDGGGVWNWYGTLTMTDSTVSGNSAAYDGGGVFNAGTLTMTGSAVSGNLADLTGGGVYSLGTLTMTGSTVSGNSATYIDGGGVWSSGTLTMIDSTVSGNSAHYYGGGVFNQGTVTLTGSTVSGNRTSRAGGGLSNRGYATLLRSTISDNTAGVGGGIENSVGTATLTDSTVSGNSASYLYGGGGIYNTGTVTLTGSTVSGNSADRYSFGGGGIFNSGTATLTGSTVSGNTAGVGGGGIGNFGTLTLTDSTVSGNSASYLYGVGGGGLFNRGNATLTDSTISGNTAARYGGGVNNHGTLTLVDSTVSGNSASYGDGGGVSNEGTLTITSSTVSDNSAGDSGGIANSSYGSATLTNTIVAGNRSAGSAKEIGGSAASSVTGSYNLIGVGGPGGLQDGVDGNIVGVSDPLLGPLGDYGGPTWTMPLLPGSRAIDAGGGDGLPDVDQRGLGRVGAPDIGAFESQGFILTVVPGGTPQSAAIGADFANPLGVVASAVNPVEPVAGGVVSFVAIPSPGGASAAFAASATIGSDGAASVVATANETPGSYSVVASALGAAAPVVFALTNGSVSATGVSIAWGTAGSADLETAEDGLRLLAEGRTTTLPWSGIRSITITFDGAATLTASDVTVTGQAVADYGPVTISRSGTAYTITLARPITSADRVTITIVDPSIATFVRRLDVLPGDVNDNGSVDAIDLMLIRRALTPYDPPDAILPMFLDINGDGVADVNDYIFVRRNVGTRLPR